MRNGKLDLGEFGPLGYVFARSLANAQPVAAFGLANGKPVTYTAAIWVPKDSSIKNVAGLEGHTLALSDPASTSGSLFPLYALIHAGLDPKKDVKLVYSGSHTASMLALVHNKIDAARGQQPAAGCGSDSRTVQGVGLPADLGFRSDHQ